MLKFDRFTVKHALKMITNSVFLTVLECTKFVFGRGPGPPGELPAFPSPLAGLRGTRLLRKKG